MARTDKDGYSEARNCSGRLLVSESNLRKYWPRHVTVMMTPRYALRCGCETCVICQDCVQLPVNALRKRIVVNERRNIKQMPRGRARNKLKAEIDEYEGEVMDELGGLRYSRMKDAVNDTLFACKRILKNERKLNHFACILGRCDKEGCGSYKAPKFELECDYKITYCLYSAHGMGNIP